MRRTTILLVIALASATLLLMSMISQSRLVRREYNAKRATEPTIAALNTALELYRLDVGAFPSEAEGLGALLETTGNPGWDGPYLVAAQTDPWGNDFEYAIRDGRPFVVSCGLDGEYGTEDDITTDKSLRLTEQESGAVSAPRSSTD